MGRPISEFCVYTIAHRAVLNGVASTGRAHTFPERKPWVTGHTLWQRAGTAGLAMPVLFADATDCSRLLFWGVLSNVRLQGNSTRFSVDRLRALPGRHSPQELVLRRTGKKIAPNFIRPYAICRTPTFVDWSDAV
jgi:hypothetical protein